MPSTENFNNSSLLTACFFFVFDHCIFGNKKLTSNFEVSFCFILFNVLIYLSCRDEICNALSGISSPKFSLKESLPSRITNALFIKSAV